MKKSVGIVVILGAVLALTAGQVWNRYVAPTAPTNLIVKP